jgi:hypothetical protein
MSAWKKTWIFVVLLAFFTVLIPFPTNFQPVQANKAVEEYYVYLPTITNFLPTIIPESTNILTGESNQYLVSISSDGIQFVFSQTTPELDRVDPDEIIVSGITSDAPYGYFRKVLTKQLINGQVILTTGPATLEEAIEQATVSFTYQFSPADIVEANTLPGVSLAALEPAAPNFDVLSLQLNQVLLGGDLVASGSFSLGLSLDFDLTIKRFSLESLHLVLEASETTALQLVSTSEAAGNEEHEIGRYRLRPVLIMAGNFPIIIQPTIVVVLGVDGTISASLTAGLTQATTLAGGVQYKDGNLSPVKEFNNNFTNQEPTISAQMAATAYAQAGLELAFYTTSPLLPELALNLRTGPRLQADQSLCWVLKGILEVNLQARLKLFKWDLDEVEATLASLETLLSQGQKCTILEISGNYHQFGALTNASAHDFGGTIQFYDYQEDHKQLAGDETTVRDVALTAGVSAIAGGAATHTASIGSIAYETVANTLGVPSIFSGTITFNTSWNYNPNSVPYSVSAGLADGYYAIHLIPKVSGDFVLKLSSEVDRSSDTGAKGGYVYWNSGNMTDTYNIPVSGSEEITRSVTANSIVYFYYHPHGNEFSIQSLEAPLSGWGSAHTTFQWTFIPGGVP